MNKEEIAARSNTIYDQARSEGATVHDRVLWSDPAKQYYRFYELIKCIDNIDAPDIDILDVGCGNGELLKFLNFNGFRGRYRGVDIHPDQVEEARGRFPDSDFRTCNVLDTDIEPADVVLMSGVFNINCGQDTGFVEQLVHRCANLSRDRFAFNAISTYVTFRDKGFFYLAPEDAIRIAASISPRFELRHGFIPYNYTICIHSGRQSWKSQAWDTGAA